MERRQPGDQPQWLACPPAPQIFPGGQLPQEIAFPQPSPFTPHSKPCSAQVFGTQSEGWQWPATHVPWLGQGQSNVLPQ